MEEENAMTMNLDLNLTPVDSSSTNNELASGSEPIALMNLEEWLQDPNRRIREAVMYRNQRWRSFWRQLPIPQETRNLAMGLIAGNEIQTGHVEPVESHRNEEAKVHENSNGPLKDETLDKKKDAEKDNSDEGNYFDCSICLDLAKEPVVTCCGHLFCWPCIYRWLHLHSEAKECPVCKGEVTTKKVTPIYGRGFNTRKPDSETMKIPLRPQAQRIESWRQSVQRTAFTIPMEEMIRRLGATFDFSRDLQVPSLHPNAPPNESPDITNSLLNRLMTNRGLRGDTTPIITSNERIDSTDFSTRNFETRASDHRFSPSLLQRSNAHHLANNASAINISSDELLAADMSLESYLNNNPLFERYQDLTLPYNDRNSVSSIAAGIHSESPTIDNAVEINSTLAQHSASSSRRRNDSSSRVSDVSGGDYRPSNRRRLY